MPNNYLSVLYKHIIQVENKNVGLKVCVCVGGGGHKHTPVNLHFCRVVHKTFRSSGVTFYKLFTSLT